jgi:hypothetical protein
MVLGINFTHSKFFVDQCKKAFDGEWHFPRKHLPGFLAHACATWMRADVDVDKDGALDLKELYLVRSTPSLSDICGLCPSEVWDMPLLHCHCHRQSSSCTIP